MSLPSARGDREQLDAAGLLRCSAFVGVDVRGLCADDRSPPGQHRQQPDDVRAGAVEHRVALDALTEVPCAHLLQAGRIHVLAVRDLVAAVGSGDRSENLGVHTRVVVRGEAADGGVVECGHGVQSRGFDFGTRAAANIPKSSPEVVYFDVVPPIQFTGQDSLRRSFLRWLGEYSGPISTAVLSRATTVLRAVGGAHTVEHGLALLIDEVGE